MLCLLFTKETKNNTLENFIITILHTLYNNSYQRMKAEELNQFEWWTDLGRCSILLKTNQTMIKVSPLKRYPNLDVEPDDKRCDTYLFPMIHFSRLSWWLVASLILYQCVDVPAYKLIARWAQIGVQPASHRLCGVMCYTFITSWTAMNSSIKYSNYVQQNE